jgi:hypothetical protein
MLRKLTLAALIAHSCFSLAVAAEKDTTHPFDRNTEDLTNRGEPPMLGIHWSRELAGTHASRPSSGSPLMTNHGGKIMPTAVTQVILWGPSWANSSFVGDKITGLDS